MYGLCITFVADTCKVRIFQNHDYTHKKVTVRIFCGVSVF